MRRHEGFSVVEIALVVVVIAILGFVGYRVYDAQIASDDANSSAVQQSDSDAATTVKDIKTSGDLDSVSQSLDSTDVDSGDSTVLDEQLSF